MVSKIQIYRQLPSVYNYRAFTVLFFLYLFPVMVPARIPGLDNRESGENPEQFPLL
jgi:hypothetical protein